jgi:hypothetical protein
MPALTPASTNRLVRITEALRDKDAGALARLSLLAEGFAGGLCRTVSTLQALKGAALSIIARS